MNSSAEAGERWPAAALTVLERSRRAHGGEERWRALGTLVFERLVVSGPLLVAFGLGSTFRMPERILVLPTEARAEFEDYPQRGIRGVFQRGRVGLLGPGQDEGTALVAHRPSFRGMRKLRRWSPLDALYFFGYALTHYHALPFTLGKARLLRHVRRSDGRDALTVRFPAELHTHSNIETIHFGPDGLIQRHDYVAEIAGRWASGAHFWRNYREVAGVPIARTRHVQARLGGLVLPFPVLHAEIGAVSRAEST